ncbi:chromatin structure-remodeling complex subunit RSC1/2, partial [Phenoliferia sp. Uapishka_3]
MLPPEMQHPLQSLITSLLQLTTTSGGTTAKRYYSFLFRDLPDPREYADYYVLIKEPRSLNGVFESLKKGIYSSPLSVAYDLFLVWSNAREYNQQGSQVYNDAEKLEAYMQRLWNERTPPLPPFTSLMRPGALGFQRLPVDDSASERKANKRLKISLKSGSSKHRSTSPGGTREHKKEKKHRDKERDRDSDKPRLKVSLGSSSLATASTSASGSASTSTYNPPPPTIPSLKLKFGAPKPPAPAPVPPPPLSTAPPPAAPPPAATITIPVSANLQAAPNARPDSRMDTGGEAPSATAPKKESKKESKKERKAKEKAARQAARAAEADTGEPLLGMDKIVHSGIRDEDPGWMGGELGPNPIARYLDILQKLKDHTDAGLIGPYYPDLLQRLTHHIRSGRHMATPLLSLPDPATRQDYYKLVPNPIALDVIESRARAGEYTTPEAFDRDLHHLFQVARIFIRPETPGNVYSDLIVLQRLYQELTKRVSHLTPPRALNLSSLSSVPSGPGNLQSQNRATSPGGTADGDGKGLVTTRVTLKDKIVLDGINYKGDILRVGDWVHLINPDNPAKPIIAQIFKVYKKIDSPQRCLSVCWYYRPEETVHPASRQFYEHEVFKTSNFIDHSVEDFVERCFVMFFTKYVRGRPKPPAWKPGMPLYICEHRYKDEVKSFKKIKNWNSAVPEEIRKHEYDMDLYPDERVETLRRFKSPFVRGVVGPGGIGEAMEHEEEEQAKYHFLPGGEPATVQKLKAVKEATEAAQAAEAATNRPTALYGAEPVPSINQPGTPANSAQNRAPPPIPPPPVVPTPPPVDTTSTPAELAAAKESFQPLPSFISESRTQMDRPGSPLTLLRFAGEKFRTNDKGDLLWFVSPPVALPPVQRPQHSLDYLYWKAQKMARESALAGANGVDVEMVDVDGA